MTRFFVDTIENFRIYSIIVRKIEDFRIYSIIVRHKIVCVGNVWQMQVL